MLQVLVAISQKFCCRKEHGLCKSYSDKKRRKEKKKKVKNNGHKSVQNIENYGYLDACLKKQRRKMNKNSPYSLAEIFPSFKREISFQGAK